MKYKSKLGQRLAFSLIELSIVILVIGILVIGITQGSRIMNEAKLKSARALTMNSPIASISGLSLWMESTLEKSLDSSVADNGLVANWYDINPHNTKPNTATQSVDANKPTYIAKGINSLPSLRFFGNPTSSVFASFDHLTIGDIDLSQSGQLTIFAVTSVNSLPAANNYIIGHKSGWTRWRFGINQFQSNKGNIAVGGTWAINSPKIVSAIIYDSSIRLRLNGTQTNSGALTAGPFLQDNEVVIGGTEFTTAGAFSLDGTLGEVIVFNRALKDQEVIAVDTYLKQKWGL
jgi:hypothetical protein